MGRIAGIDFGTVRIGLAVSDPSQFLATPLPHVLAQKDMSQTATLIMKQLNHPVDKIVLGLPLHLNGNESPLSTQVRAFAKILEETAQIPIILWDERLSTAQVERTLKEAQINRKKRTPLIDSLTAATILQSYLESL